MHTPSWTSDRPTDRPSVFGYFDSFLPPPLPKSLAVRLPLPGLPLEGAPAVVPLGLLIHVCVGLLQVLGSWRGWEIKKNWRGQ